MLCWPGWLAGVLQLFLLPRPNMEPWQVLACLPAWQLRASAAMSQRMYICKSPTRRRGSNQRYTHLDAMLSSYLRGSRSSGLLRLSMPARFLSDPPLYTRYLRLEAEVSVILGAMCRPPGSHEEEAYAS